MAYPLVVAGGPVRNREWIVAEWLAGLLCQDYPAERLLVVPFVNDSTDRTYGICRWFYEQFPGRVYLLEDNYGAGEGNVTRLGRDYGHMARLRNTWLAAVDTVLPFDYLWCVDSDVVFRPDCLKRLLAHGKEVVAPLISLGDWHCNAMYWRDPEVGLEGGFRWNPETIEAEGLIQADFVCGTQLVHRSVFARGVRWGNHEYAEDAYFCGECEKRGIPLWAAADVRGDHHMNAERCSLVGTAAAPIMAEFWRNVNEIPRADQS